MIQFKIATDNITVAAVDDASNDLLLLMILKEILERLYDYEGLNICNFIRKQILTWTVAELLIIILTNEIWKILNNVI